MIDINELRRKISSVDIVDHVDIHANVKPTLTELLYRLEVAEIEVALKERVIDALGSELNAVAKERDELRARIEAMEKQKPVAFGLYSGWAIKAAYLKEHEACEQRDRRQLTADLSGSLEAYRVVPLYALPGAAPEAKP